MKTDTVFTLEMFENAKTYWLEKLSGELNEPDWIGDFPGNSEYSEARYDFLFGKEASEKLIFISKNNDLSLYVILMSVFKILLYRFTDQQDIIVSSPTLSQSRQSYNQGIALRDYISPSMSFKDFLMRVKETVVSGYKHQFYPIRDLIKVLNIENQRLLFKFMLVLENIQKKEFCLELQKESENEIIFSVNRNEKELKGCIIYNSKLYRKVTIRKLWDCYSHILSQVLVDTQIKISHLEVLTAKERQKILVDFNNTGAGCPEGKTINEFFQEQVERIPDNTALVGSGQRMAALSYEEVVTRGEKIAETIQLTYSELDRHSRRLALALRKKGVTLDVAVGLMMKRSIEMIIGQLGVLKAGGAYLLLDPDFPRERIRYMLADCRAHMVVTESLIGISTKEEDTFIPIPNQPGPMNLAYVIYTSGTTGRPRGVMVEHGNVGRLVKDPDYIDFEEGGRLLLTGAIGFDINTFEIWGPLLNGLSLYLVEENMILDAEKLAETIALDQISILHLIPQLFNQFADQDPAIFEKLDWLMVGGDLVKPYYVNIVRKRNKNLRILHMYGPTENTTFSTFLLVDKDYENKIPIGRPIGHSTVYIIDKNGKLKPIGTVGELAVAGAGLARGYLNNPELTKDKFCLRRPCGTLFEGTRGLAPLLLKGTDKDHMPHHSLHSPIYRTGDLCRWLPQGDLELLGRRDHQVKIRGMRIELGEIENRLLSHEAVKEAAVTVIDYPDGLLSDKTLCAYIVSAGFDTEELKQYLSQSLPDYMIPLHFIQLEKIPLTANGKIDRKALPAPEIKAGENYTAPRDEIEEKLVKIWTEVLNLHDASIGIDDNFFELGGHSLKATIMVSKIHKALHVRLPLEGIFLTPTIRRQAQQVKKLAKERYSAIAAVEKKEYYELSSAQKRVYIYNQGDQRGTGYNMLWVVFMEGSLEKEKLEKAFKKLLRIHESLRTCFKIVNDVPVQAVYTGVPFEIDYYNLTAGAGNDQKEEAGILRDFVKPFDLRRAPLLRAGLIKLNAEKHILLVDIHHIVADGTSCIILQTDFLRLYKGEQLSPLEIQYKDFSCWQNRLFAGDRIKKQENYWLNIYANVNEIPELELPTDYPRQDCITYNGDRCEFKLGIKETADINKLCFNTGTTLYMNLLAVFNILLYKYTSQNNIIVGTGIMGRQHAELHYIIGMFINMLAVQNFPKGEKTYRQFLEEVKVNSLNAFENQDMQFEMLVDKLKLKRRPSRSLLFDVAFTVNNFALQTPIFGGNPGEIIFTPHNYEKINARYDLVLDAHERDGGIYLNLTYKTGLFKKTTVEKMGQRYLDILKQVLENRDIKLEEITIDYDLLNVKPGILQEDKDDFDF